MNEIPLNPMLDFNTNQLKEVRKLFGYEDLNRLQQDLEIFENWIQKQQHFTVKKYDKAYLERQLICSKGSVERAKKRLDKLCTLRGLMPDYLQNFDVKNEFNNLLNVTYTCFLPKPTQDNYRLIFTNFINPDASIYESRYMSRFLLLMIEYFYRHDYCAGLELVVDTRNITLGIISKLNPIIIGNTFMIINEALGLRIKAIHLVSESIFLDTMMTIFKQGISKKIFSRFRIYDSFEPLFQYLPKELLPKEIGGHLPISLKEINDNNFKQFSSPEFIEQMKFMETAVTDESKRLKSQFNEAYSGMPGSFKVLTVD